MKSHHFLIVAVIYAFVIGWLGLSFSRERTKVPDEVVQNSDVVGELVTPTPVGNLVFKKPLTLLTPDPEDFFCLQNNGDSYKGPCKTPTPTPSPTLYIDPKDTALTWGINLANQNKVLFQIKADGEICFKPEAQSESMKKAVEDIRNQQ